MNLDEAPRLADVVVVAIRGQRAFRRRLLEQRLFKGTRLQQASHPDGSPVWTPLSGLP